LTSALTRERVVVDTNALIGGLLLPDSVPARAVHAVVTGAILLSSEATIAELAEVLAREKFDPYVGVPDRQQFLRLLSRVTEIVPVTHTVRACRDPRDDKFLELAVNGEATLIVTGDNDLLPLNPFRDIPIITPASYLAR
jgi:putative PIN family toxin of toxin-antitoxin system